MRVTYNIPRSSLNENEKEWVRLLVKNDFVNREFTSNELAESAGFDDDFRATRICTALSRKRVLEITGGTMVCKFQFKEEVLDDDGVKDGVMNGEIVCSKHKCIRR